MSLQPRVTSSGRRVWHPDVEQRDLAGQRRRLPFEQGEGPLSAHRAGGDAGVDVDHRGAVGGRGVEQPAATAAIEYQGGGEAAVFASIEEKLCRNTREVLEAAQQEQILPRDAALAMARRRVDQAMSHRRWNIF